MKIHLFILGLFIFILSSCVHKELKEEEIEKIDLFPNNIHKIKLEELKDYFFVPLAYNDEFLIKHIDKIFVTEKEIIISDLGKEVFIFDKKGKPIQKISEIGKGPGEYSFMADVLFDEKKKQIEILDHSGKKICCYNLKGEFLYERQIPNYFKKAGTRFYKNNNNYIFDRVQLKSDGNRVGLYGEDKLEFTKSFLELPKCLLNFHFVYPHIIENFDGFSFYLPDLDDRIYKITKDTIFPVYEFKYKGKSELNINPEERMTDLGKYMSINSRKENIFNLNSLFISDRYVSFKYRYKNQLASNTLFYSKKSGKTLSYNELMSSENDKFRIVISIKAKFGEYFIMEIPEPMNEFLPENIKRERNEYSNPVLLFFKLNDF